MTGIHQKIQEKAYELFKRYGIRSVTMDDIASQCGISKKTLYQQYEDKHNLVLSIVDEMVHRSETRCVSFIDSSQNAIHEIFQSLAMLQEMFSGVNPSLLFDLSKYHAPAFRRIDDHKHRFLHGTILKNLRRGIEEGIYRPELNVEIIALLHLHNISMIFEEDLLPRMKFSVLEMQLEVMVHFLYGIATPKGVKLIEKYKKNILKQQSL